MIRWRDLFARLDSGRRRRRPIVEFSVAAVPETWVPDPPRRHAAACCVIALVGCLGFRGEAGAQTILPNFGLTDGAVRAIALAGGTLFIGGDFTRVGVSPVQGAATLDPVTAEAAPTFPRIAGTVYAVAPDGQGGWYVGGQFSSVGGLPRNGIAHVMADHSVSAWNPSADGAVFALTTDGETVYAGGAFSSVGGASRSRIAALDATTGSATPWNPAADGTVRALAVRGSTVYAAGDFTSIGGAARAYVAALDANGDLDTSWGPLVNGYVRAIAVANNKIFLGGDFTTVDGTVRAWLAAVNHSDGRLTSWFPNVNAPVRTLALSSAGLYVGGDFTAFGLQTRNHIAAVDPTNAALSPWDPNADGVVEILTLDGGLVYAGGRFTTIGGQSRGHVAALDAGGMATSWAPFVEQPVLALSASGSSVFAGGETGRFGGRSRSHVAAFDVATGQLSDWNPSFNSPVWALAVDGNTIYVGGEFTTIGGQPRNHVAALDLTTGAPTPWNPDADGTVRTLAPNGSTIYVGGDFTHIGGQVRNRIGALDAATGLPASWDPSADGPVLTMALSGSTLYAGGGFTAIGGQLRNHIGALDLASGLATAWDPDAQGNCRSSVFCLWGSCHYWEQCTGVVSCLVVSDGVVYAAGDFETIGGQLRNRMAAVDINTGLPTSWDPNAGDCVEICSCCGGGSCDAGGDYWDYWDCPNVGALAVNGAAIEAGGHFNEVGGQPRPGFAAMDQLTGLPTSWIPPFGGTVNAMARSGSTLYVGGWVAPTGSDSYTGLLVLEGHVVAVGAPTPSNVGVRLRCEPNPFTTSARIQYAVANRGPVWVALYDLAGRRIATLLDGVVQAPGLHDLELAGEFPAGMYVCRLRADGLSRNAKVFRMR